MKFVSREQWGARKPTRVTPVGSMEGNTVHYEGPRMGTFSHDSCAGKVRSIQSFHMGPERGWSDIAYNSVICPHGYVYEGRWFKVKSGANGTSRGNAVSYSHCVLIGEGDAFPEAAREAVVEVISLFRMKAAAGKAVWVHSDWKPTACPGDTIRHWVKSGMPLAQPAVIADPPEAFPNRKQPDMFLAQNIDDGKVYLVTDGGLAHVSTATDLRNIQEALGSNHIARLSGTTMASIRALGGSNVTP